VASFRVKAPFFVAAQLKRHAIGLSVNEVSRRYVKTDPEFWDCGEWRSACDDKKQGSGDPLFGGEYGSQWDASEAFEHAMANASESYKELIDLGVCEEQARTVLPMATMTSWIWTGSLAAWARVCKQRCKPDAQKETRDVAEMISDHCAKLWPVSWAALT
jgi:thymidylate synthase (FAD)